MSSLSKGLSEFVASTPSTPPTQLRRNEIFPAYVVEVIQDKDSEYYDGPESIGAVRFKQIPNDNTKSEKISNKIAYPMDRANFVEPLAGEQVLCTMLFDTQSKPRYYYIATVSTEQTAAAVISPFLGTDLGALKEDGWPVPSIAEKRFDDHNGYDIDNLKQRVSQEKVREGDKVLEGKFGGVIKFTHTIGKDKIWDQQNQITNLPTLDNMFGTAVTEDGDPMIIIKSSIRSNKFEFEDDDINVDESSMYLTTTQSIPIELKCGQLKSYQMHAGIGAFKDISVLGDEDVSTLSKIFGGKFDPNANQIKAENVHLTGTPQVKLVPGLQLDSSGNQGPGGSFDITGLSLEQSNPEGPWNVSNGAKGSVKTAYELRYHHNTPGDNPEPDPANTTSGGWSRTKGGSYVYDMVLSRVENGARTARPWLPAPVDGVVSFAGFYSNGMDSAIEIKATDGQIYKFLHTDNMLVKVGTPVRRGQLIARQSDQMSEDFAARNVHLHIQFPSKQVLVDFIRDLVNNTFPVVV